MEGRVREDLVGPFEADGMIGLAVPGRRLNGLISIEERVVAPSSGLRCPTSPARSPSKMAVAPIRRFSSSVRNVLRHLDHATPSILPPRTVGDGAQGRRDASFGGGTGPVREPADEAERFSGAATF